MKIYIHGAGMLSAAGSSDATGFPFLPPQQETDSLLCKEPDYSPWIAPMQLRRMSKAVRMGIGAAKICLQSSGKENADALSVGTALGCLHDTEVFLSKMIDQDEQMLTPTAFIQSTHNTVAGQIALITQCHGQNLTYVHRGHSFEHAMINASLFLNEHAGQSVLVGGIEELTATSLSVMQTAKVYRHEKTLPERVLAAPDKGSLAGEGASFFYVSGQPAERSVAIHNIFTFTTRDTEEAVSLVKNFIAGSELTIEDIDFVLTGRSGDLRTEGFYDRLEHELFKDTSTGSFKQFCGAYPVDASFGLGILYRSMMDGLPESLKVKHKPTQLKKVMLINNFLHHYACWYLSVT